MYCTVCLYIVGSLVHELMRDIFEIGWTDNVPDPICCEAITACASLLLELSDDRAPHDMVAPQHHLRNCIAAVPHGLPDIALHCTGKYSAGCWSEQVMHQMNPLSNILNTMRF